MKKLLSILILCSVFSAANAQLRDYPFSGIRYRAVVKHTLKVDTSLILANAKTYTINFASTAAGTSTQTTVTFYGAAVGDAVLVVPGLAAIAANSFFNGYVSAANTVAVKFNNYSSGAIDPASAVFTIRLIK